ncbi:hypothetical protein [Rhizobium sp. RU36D]|uniref:hypothetical protein n=1 Tax=Rhizobium sp. RU36D TaxID=1907415 RepID=UPI001179AE6E|nr:hypothetical protein [Rhizobium sp. RU36D]
MTTTPVIPRLLVFVIFFLVFYHKIQPLDFDFIRPGVDPSWEAALVYGLERGLIFGKDLVFTGGPLSFLYTRQFSEQFAYTGAIISLSTVLFLAISLTALLNGRTMAMFGKVIIVGVTLSLTILTIDSIYLLVPLLTGLNGLATERGRQTIVSLAGAFLCGIIILAKFSVFPIATLAVLALDGTAAIEKRPPIHTLFLVAGVCFGWALCGQPIDQLPNFILAGLETSSGYSSAMSLTASHGPSELVAWLAITFLFVMTLVAIGFLNREKDGRVRTIARIVVISGYLFVSFKAGMVRHDLHSLIAWGSLTAVVVSTAQIVRNITAASIVLNLLAILLVLPGHWLLYRENPIVPSVDLSGLATSIQADATGLASFIVHPEAWLDDLQARNDASAAAIQQATPLPRLDGSVDIIPSAQSTVIAHNLRYSPRPTVQEYTTYSPKLIARNRANFSGTEAPDYLIMEPGSIDARHPASAEGALWPLFFSRYEPDQSSVLGLVLKKREAPLQNVLEAPIEVETAFDQEVAFPRPDRAWMVSIDIKPTLLGRLIDLFYRPPMSQMTINYTDGTSRTYRMIPNMMGDGLLLSPHVGNTTEYLMVSTGHVGYPGLKFAKSFVVETGTRPGVFYQSAVRVKFSAIDTTALAARQINDFTRSMLARAERTIGIVANNRMQPPMIDVSSEGVFAHAPAVLRMPVTSGSEATFFFGMRDGSWSGEAGTDGVCFAIGSASRGIAERCLDPANVSADRGEQTMRVVIPSGVSEIQLETSCRGSCASDWSYWGGVEFR